MSPYVQLIPPTGRYCGVQEYAEEMTSGTNCGTMVHSTSSYGENLYLCWATAVGCYTAKSAGVRWCECSALCCVSFALCGIACAIYSTSFAITTLKSYDHPGVPPTK